MGLWDLCRKLITLVVALASQVNLRKTLVLHWHQQQRIVAAGIKYVKQPGQA